MKITYTKEQICEMYEEACFIEQLVYRNIGDGEDEIKQRRRYLLDGIYIAVIFGAQNTSECVSWCRELESKLL